MVMDNSKAKAKRERLKVCFCAFPFATQAGHIHPFTVTRILQAITDKLWLISRRMPEGDLKDLQVEAINLRVTMRLRASSRPSWFSALIWALKYMAVQLEMSYYLIRLAGKVNIVVFYEGPHYALPAVVARLLGKRVVKYSPGNVAVTRLYPRLSIDHWASYLFTVSDRIVHSLAHRIVMPTEDCLGATGLGRYRGKTSTAMYSYIGDAFCEKKEWCERSDVCGYVGRLMEVKGVLQLAKAIPLILGKRKVHFLIVGDGVLMPEMKKILKEAGCLDMVDFLGWVPNEDIPGYLNEMKFHILPSYSEFPGVINLEAMACGTIAIANAVGGIPDIVKDGKTGFLMKNNEPTTIADIVIEAWERPELDKIRKEAGVFARRNFSFQKVTQDWSCILSSL